MYGVLLEVKVGRITVDFLPPYKYSDNSSFLSSFRYCLSRSLDYSYTASPCSSNEARPELVTLFARRSEEVLTLSTFELFRSLLSSASQAIHQPTPFSQASYPAPPAPTSRASGAQSPTLLLAS